MCICFAACSQETPAETHVTNLPLSPAETVAGTGHRVFFNSAGKVIQLDEHALIQNQRRLAENWGVIAATHLPPAEEIEVNFQALDLVLARASEERRPGAGSDRQVNTALHHLFRSQFAPRGNVRRSALATTKSEDAYITQCAEEGVPYPDLVMNRGEGWKNHGVLETDFLEPDFLQLFGKNIESELWSWESSPPKPEGICVALPRWDKADPKRSVALGLICMGRETGKVCYWDWPLTAEGKPRETSEPIDYSIPIQDFAGGYELEINGGGTCSDCHAGGNPFIVHPDDPAFDKFLAEVVDIMPSRWPEPIVHPSWPQNPGPLPALPRPGTGQLSCTQCHRAGGPANEFPIISSALPRYCDTILRLAIDYPTMPPLLASSGPDEGNYSDDKSYLLSLCNAPPFYGPGKDIGTVNYDPPGDDLSFLSPPIILEPLYECASTIGVRGARIGATVVLLADGQVVDSKAVANPDFTEFDIAPSRVSDLTPPLSAIQIVGNDQSVPSREVVSRDYLMDYPNGLPGPTFNPPQVYECASKIAVEHVPGATLRVTTNGNTPPREKPGSARGHTIAWADGPFAVDDVIEVEQVICDQTSPASSIVVDPAPTVIPAVRIEPFYEGQQLLRLRSIIQGSNIEIMEDSLGGIDFLFSWPLPSHVEYNVATPLGRLTQAGDVLSAQQELCDPGPAGPSELAIPCEELGPPKIAPPMAGDQDLVVNGAAPGAVIRVYDDNGAEIGDGGGTLIALARALIGGEVITVVQDMGPNCPGQFGTDVVVRGAP